MCGIVGTLNLTSQHPIEELTLRQMLAMIRHRGPDQFGIYRDEHVGLGNARLSIIDLSTGQQPIGNEDGTLWIVFNGEIFNYVELRPELEAHGHRFETHTDTEVILHLYEDYGPGLPGTSQRAVCLRHLGCTRSERCFWRATAWASGRCIYTVADGALIFGSEIKAILADPRVAGRDRPAGARSDLHLSGATLSPTHGLQGHLRSAARTLPAGPSTAKFTSSRTGS